MILKIFVLESLSEWDAQYILWLGIQLLIDGVLLGIFFINMLVRTGIETLLVMVSIVIRDKNVLKGHPEDHKPNHQVFWLLFISRFYLSIARFQEEKKPVCW